MCEQCTHCNKATNGHRINEDKAASVQGRIGGGVGARAALHPNDWCCSFNQSIICTHQINYSSSSRPALSTEARRGKKSKKMQIASTVLHWVKLRPAKPASRIALWSSGRIKAPRVWDARSWCNRASASRADLLLSKPVYRTLSETIGVGCG